MRVLTVLFAIFLLVVAGCGGSGNKSLNDPCQLKLSDNSPKGLKVTGAFQEILRADLTIYSDLTITEFWVVPRITAPLKLSDPAIECWEAQERLCQIYGRIDDSGNFYFTNGLELKQGQDVRISFFANTLSAFPGPVSAELFFIATNADGYEFTKSIAGKVLIY